MMSIVDDVDPIHEQVEAEDRTNTDKPSTKPADADDEKSYVKVPTLIS